MVCWPSIESKGSLDGHVGLVRALKPRNLLAWTYSEKVMHACLQMHVGWFGYQFRAKITLWYVPNAVFKRLFTFKLINLWCVLNFALDLVEFSSKLESIYIYICCKKNTQIAYSNSFSNEVQVTSSNHLLLNNSHNPCPHTFMQCMHVGHLSFAKVESYGKAQSLASPLGAGRWGGWWSRQFLQILILFRDSFGPIVMCKPTSYLYPLR